MLKAQQTRGLRLEAQVLETLGLNAYNVSHTTRFEDLYRAQDFTIAGCPVQVTVQKWDSYWGLANLMAKIDWTEQKSNAIVVAFDKSAMMSQWPAMILLMGKAIKKLAKMGVRTHLRISSDKMEFLCNGQWKEVKIS